VRVAQQAVRRMLRPPVNVPRLLKDMRVCNAHVARVLSVPVLRRRFIDLFITTQARGVWCGNMSRNCIVPSQRHTLTICQHKVVGVTGVVEGGLLGEYNNLVQQVVC